MDEMKNQMEFSVNPEEEEEEEEEDGFMVGCNSGSGSSSRSVFMNRKLEKNRLRIRFKMRNSEDCNGGDSANVSNETSSTMNLVSQNFKNRLVNNYGGAKNRGEEAHHDSTKREGIEKVTNYGKKRNFELKNHRRRVEQIPIKLEFGEREERASVTDESYEEDDEKGKPMCSLCGKNFPSMKSLFGHMRCHPDRDWRGMVPPEKVSVLGKKNSHPSSVSDSSTDISRIRKQKSSYHLDQVDSLSSWSVTARRGRIRTVSESPDFSDDQISHAAYQLLVLANGDSREENSKESEGRNREFGELGFVEKVKFEKPKRRNSDFRSRTVEKITENQVSCRSEQRKRRRKIRTLEKVQDLAMVDSKLNAEKYKCNTCNKSFSSHQALGGHRASHKKGRNSSSCNGGIDEFSVGEFAEEEGSLMVDRTNIENSPESGGQPWPEIDMVHRCQICNRGFATGQALGGHKRCHWTGDRQAMADHVTASSSVEIPVDGRKIIRGLPDFDLNEPPMIEEDLDSAISMIDLVPSSCQSLGPKFKDHASFYCNSVI